MAKTKKYNDCKKCPYYGSYYDSFIGDGDEWCSCGICGYGEPIECRYPLFIRHILAWIEKRKQAKFDKQAEISYWKEQDEMQRLGMDEESFCERNLALQHFQETGKTKYFYDDSGNEYWYIEDDTKRHYTRDEG